MFKIEVIGNIGADAKIVNTNGSEFVSFSLAHTDKQGEKDVTTWVSVNHKNTKLAQYLLKGAKVYVRGNAVLKTYKNERGETLIGINLFASELEFCGSKADSSVVKETTPSISEQKENVEKKKDDEELPF